MIGLGRWIRCLGQKNHQNLSGKDNLVCLQRHHNTLHDKNIKMEFKELNQIVTKKIGTSLNIEDKHTIANLNQIPQKLIENAELLVDRYEIQCYLQFYTTPDNENFLRHFVFDVFTLNQNVNTWKKGRALIANSSLKDQLSKEKEDLFGYPISEFKHIVKPDYEYWKEGIHHTGMFVFLEPDADYKVLPKEGYSTLPLKTADFIAVEQKDIELFYRRWIASRIAIYLQVKGQWQDLENGKVFDDIIPQYQWTQDAHYALKGLIKERNIEPPNEKLVPGFYGPDEYYMS